MSQWVLDASVIIKWLIPESPAEQHVLPALALLSELQKNRITVRQPPHWLLEVAAVGVRLKPDSIHEDLADLQEIGITTEPTTPALLQHACELAQQLNHHLFDTLYHAVALQTGATLVTADERYFHKAQALGQIMLLANFRRS